MIVLDNAGTRALSLITAQNGAQAEVSFSDYTTSTGAYARGVPTLTTISSATTTSICATPASGVIRDVDYVNIKNTFAGSHTMTVQITSGSGGPFVLLTFALLQDESMSYTHGSGWCAMDANGNRKQVTSSTFATLTVTGNATIGGTLGVTGAITGSSTISGNSLSISTTGDFGGQLQGIKSTATQIRAYGWDAVSGTGTDRGSIELGSAATYFGRFGYANTGYLYIDNAYDNAAGAIYLRLRTLGSAVNALIMTGTTATFIGTVTVTGGATFLTTSSALTNGAGASAGTITNAPSVGNPTKWIGINDNGTTRYIPAW